MEQILALLASVPIYVWAIVAYVVYRYRKQAMKMAKKHYKVIAVAAVVIWYFSASIERHIIRPSGIDSLIR